MGSGFPVSVGAGMFPVQFPCNAGTSGTGHLWHSPHTRRGINVTSSLGPMPPSLQELVERWIEIGRSADQTSDDRVSDALFIYGGPVLCCYLTASGEVLEWDAWDDIVTTIADGPSKVSTIVCAAQHRPELAGWLPVRPLLAHDCEWCDGEGWRRAPLPKIICTVCSGLGWLLSEPE
jgi:hypothetical protein